MRSWYIMNPSPFIIRFTDFIFLLQRWSMNQNNFQKYYILSWNVYFWECSLFRKFILFFLMQKILLCFIAILKRHDLIQFFIFWFRNAKFSLFPNSWLTVLIDKSELRLISSNSAVMSCYFYFQTSQIFLVLFM